MYVNSGSSSLVLISVVEVIMIKIMIKTIGMEIIK